MDIYLHVKMNLKLVKILQEYNRIKLVIQQMNVMLGNVVQFWDIKAVIIQYVWIQFHNIFIKI
jgi:hypothetical protein